jgi:hypothetical protein
VRVFRDPDPDWPAGADLILTVRWTGDNLAELASVFTTIQHAGPPHDGCLDVAGQHVRRGDWVCLADRTAVFVVPSTTAGPVYGPASCPPPPSGPTASC